jgi:hypothetical protein
MARAWIGREETIAVIDCHEFDIGTKEAADVSG